MIAGGRRAPWSLARLVDGLAGARRTHGLTLVGGDGQRRRLTWCGLHRAALHLASSWARLGLGSGERVLLCLTQRPEHLVAFLALARMGAVPCLAPAPLAGQDAQGRRDALARLVDVSGAHWSLGQSELRAAGCAVQALPTTPRHGDPARPLVAPPSLESIDPDAPAVVQFSSGSTSRPKGVCLTHRNLATNVRLLVEAGPRRPGDSLVTWIPLSHDMGFVGTWLTSLQVQPREHVLIDPWRFMLRPRLWFEELARTRARISACPASALEHCARRLATCSPHAPSLDLQHLESLMVGAESVHEDSVRRFERALAPCGLRAGVVRPVYGLAEATLIVTAHPRGRGLIVRQLEGRPTVSVGQPLGDFRVRVVGPDGLARPTGAVGEIEIRGASVMAGYLTGPARRRGQWLRTGDLGALDEEGRLFIRGRAKDLLVVGGRNFYAHDVQHALADLACVKPGRAHAFAYGAAGRARIVVVAVPRGGHGGDGRARREQVKRRVLERCGLAVDEVVFVSHMPRTPSGKIRRAACERLAQAQAVGAGR